MEFRLNGLYSGGNRIQEVDDVEFVCNALKEIKNYRIIGDNIVKKSDFMTCGEGNCFLVYENMPIFEIDFGNQECC